MSRLSRLVDKELLTDELFMCLDESQVLDNLEDEELEELAVMLADTVYAFLGNLDTEDIDDTSEST